MKYTIVLIMLALGWYAKAQELRSYTVEVHGSCGMCKDRIEDIATAADGVESATWSATRQVLTIQGDDQVDLNAIEMELAFAGHDTEHQLAPDDIYDALPYCCQYRPSTATSMLEPLSGSILQGEATSPSPAIGATVAWLDGSAAVATDEDGHFTLERTTGAHRIVVSYVGYQPDTIEVGGQSFVQVALASLEEMEGVTIRQKRRSTQVSFINPLKVQKVTEEELFKAACCNLSESFETNATIDAANTDAVTGIRQIRMLGLTGPNVLMTRETVPFARGISSLFGLHLTPGPWISGMFINTGIGSVLNGYDGPAGQIDVVMRDPSCDDRLFVNLFSNAASRREGNINVRHQLSDRLSTSLLLHGHQVTRRNDQNDDGFLDRPVQDMYNVMNRWKVVGNNGWQGQVALGAAKLSNQGGQTEYREEGDAAEDFWGSTTDLDQYYGWLKIGKIYTNRPKTSLGLQISFDHSDQDLTFGERRYLGRQNNLYTQLAYHTTLDPDAHHRLKVAANGQVLHVDETLAARKFERDERSVGLIGEYAYLPNETFSLIAGLRVDHHDDFGTFVTPRLHLRKALTDALVWRAGIGRAQRTASPLSESLSAMASNRTFLFRGNDDDTPYGLDPTVAWSMGSSVTYDAKLLDRPILIQAEYYWTRFTSGMVRDFDENPQALLFYNLDGTSRSHSMQAQVDYEAFDRFDVRVAYRYNDVRTDLTNFDHQLHPMQSPHRFFVNAAYATKTGWAIDVTGNWLSRQRLPNTSSNPEAFRLAEYSPDFMRWNTQLTKTWGEWLAIYVGVNNLFNYQVEDGIIAADDPTSPYFDASMIWGPVFGQEWYAGLRYNLPYK